MSPFRRVRIASEFSTCSPNEDTVRCPRVLLSIQSLSCPGQRKRERLRSLETILQASSTNVAQSLNREGQLEHSTKPLAPEPCGTVKLGNNPLYDPFQDFGNTAVDPSFMSLAPYDMTFNPSAISSSYIGNQFGISPGLTYGMP